MISKVDEQETTRIDTAETALTAVS